MLTCVCRPVSSSFADKQSIMGAPLERDDLVVTSEPKTRVGAAKATVHPHPQVPPDVCMLDVVALSPNLPAFTPVTRSSLVESRAACYLAACQSAAARSRRKI